MVLPSVLGFWGRGSVSSTYTVLKAALLTLPLYHAALPSLSDCSDHVHSSYPISTLWRLATSKFSNHNHHTSRSSTDRRNITTFHL